VCAAVLLCFSRELQALEFPEIIVFLQNLPTQVRLRRPKIAIQPRKQKIENENRKQKTENQPHSYHFRPSAPSILPRGAVSLRQRARRSDAWAWRRRG